MSWLEVIMLVCFGVSWPISIAKALRTKVVAGKSPLFMLIVCIGYLSGIFHKLLYSRDGVVFLYAFNMVMVALDLALYLHYAGKNARDLTEPVLP
ncbi:MAG: hypothetical protein JXB04_10975 [Kiritimatiellae bacterium]|nr:hypothetical protein [Kiritimatiellia bacterium]